MTTGLLGAFPLVAYRLWAGPDGVTPPVVLTGIGVGLLLTLLWVRLPRTGLYIQGDTLIAKCWWSTKRFQRDELVRSRSEPYSGWFYVFGWPVPGGVLQSGHVVLETPRMTYELGGTVTSMGAARRQSEAINRWLGSEVGAGTGERRARAARRRGTMT
jgi:hypothetical protein